MTARKRGHWHYDLHSLRSVHIPQLCFFPVLYPPLHQVISFRVPGDLMQQPQFSEHKGIGCLKPPPEAFVNDCRENRANRLVRAQWTYVKRTFECTCGHVSRKTPCNIRCMLDYKSRGTGATCVLFPGNTQAATPLHDSRKKKSPKVLRRFISKLPIKFLVLVDAVANVSFKIKFFTYERD